tara:strand:+ start:794 stop:1219 length:426 start_codon:yes stop_codon:yes gene_type:complete
MGEVIRLQCSKCNLWKNYTAFSKSKKAGKSRGYRRSRCKECVREYVKTAPSNSYENNKRRAVLRNYGITLEEYYVRISTSSVCEICGVAESKENPLCYDHDHNTMKFRGVLCSKCNRSLGQLGDDLEGLNKAISYLKKVRK